MPPFIGRNDELNYLKLLLSKKSASLVVLHGRRRIGKSRLIAEFAKTMPKSYLFTGLPPTRGVTKQSQLDKFCEQMARNFGVGGLAATNWGDAFTMLAKFIDGGRVVVALDEISWIGSKDPHFLGELKTAWDLHFSKNEKLILILCGSVSSWIEENILKSTGFVGRISADIHLNELPLNEAAKFWGNRLNRTSAMEILKLLAVTGGVPRYLEELKPALLADDNIRHMCFNSKGLLFNEFDQIFSDLFSTRAQAHATLVNLLANGSMLLAELATKSQIPEGTLHKLLNELVQAGFISADPTWNIKTMKPSRFKSYRLSDNYLRFYLKYIRPQKESIEQGVSAAVSIGQLPHWNTVMGLQFENLVVRNAHLVMGALGIDPAQVVLYGPYRQRATKRRQGCQIDFLIQTKLRTVYICEVKFSNNHVGMDAVHALSTREQSLALPRGWSKRLVLIHVNGVTSDVLQADVVDHFVDFSKLIYA